MKAGERADVSRVSSGLDADSHAGVGAAAPPVPTGEAGPFGWLPRVSRRQFGLERRLERWTRAGGVPPPLGWLRAEMGLPVAIDRPEVLWRASGLGRAGLVAQLSLPRLATRLAVGIETPLAHGIVDRLLGFDRPFAESRLQLTPVEWGIWTFIALRALDALDSAQARGSPARGVAPLALVRGELTLDRVGPDPFDPTGLGSIVTVRWPVRVGPVAAAMRLWVPESMVSRWLAEPYLAGPAHDNSDGPATSDEPATDSVRQVPLGQLSGVWRAEAGLVTLAQGLRRLRIGGVVPLSDSRLSGKPASPGGIVDLVLELDDQGSCFRIPTRPVAESGGRLVRLEARPRRETRPRSPIAVTESEQKPMSQPGVSSGSPAAVNPLDVPVTLTVELGRVNLTLTQLADLKPSDVVELNRHSRAPVDLTSNGRLVARGELILIDTDLGVRVTNVFL
jgi:flagellar motor switch protein FliN